VEVTRFTDHPIFAALCLRPSATDPTPLGVLLKAKAQPQFERPFKRLSTPLFYVFQASNRGQFPACFLAFTVRSAEGRNFKKPRGVMIAAPQTVIVSERRSRESNDLNPTPNRG